MSYNMVQTVFALNIASNAACGHDDTPATLQSLLSIYLNGGTYPGNYGVYNAEGVWAQEWPGFFNTLNPSLAGGDWKIVWGPSVYTDLVNDSQIGNATNSAYVAYSPSQNSYVVAVAGTNFSSLIDWISEDLDVDPAKWVVWSDFNPLNLGTDQLTPSTTAKIDGGSALGITNLLTQLSDPSQPSGSQDLGHFLINLPTTDGFKASATLYFSGHSLGGALTQVLPLYLYKALTNAGWTTILTLPTAGPTPGNVHFAALYNETFKNDVSTGWTSVPTWNCDVISNRDAVPAAWNNLGSIFSSTPDAAGNYPSFFGMIGNAQVTITIPLLKITLKSMPLGKALGDLSLVLSPFTLFYAPVNQIPFTPTEGTFTWNKGQWSWTPYELPTDSNPIESLEALGPYVLNAHTSQYGYFFLGEPVPQFPGLQPQNS